MAKKKLMAVPAGVSQISFTINGDMSSNNNQNSINYFNGTLRWVIEGVEYNQNTVPEHTFQDNGGQGYIYADNDPGFSGLNGIALMNCNITSIDLSQATKSRYWLNLQDNSITDITFPNASYPNGPVSLYIHNNSLSGLLDLTSFHSLNALSFHHNNISNVLIPNNIFGRMLFFDASFSSFRYKDFKYLQGYFLAQQYSVFRCQSTGLTTEDVNRYLDDFDQILTDEIADVSIYLDGYGNDAPDSSTFGINGWAKKASLEAKGINVYVNGIESLNLDDDDLNLDDATFKL